MSKTQYGWIPFVRRFSSERRLWSTTDYFGAVASLVALVLAIGFSIVAILDFAGEEWGEGTARAALATELAVLAIVGLRNLNGKVRESIHKDDASINGFMRQFIGQGSTVDIVSHRLAWAERDPAMATFLHEQVTGSGVAMSIYVADDTSQPVVDLQHVGVNVFRHPPGMESYPRFTLLNRDRPGGGRLAIANGAVPDHGISVFEEKHHPQVIALAKALLASIRNQAA